MERTLIFNGKLIKAGEIIEDGWILIRGQKIEEIGTGSLPEADCTRIDAKGGYISPGFIDIHLHGGGGYDFMDGTPEAILRISEIHAAHGTTAMVPTTVSCSNNELKKFFENYSKAVKLNNKGADLLGIHLEGPYLAMSMKGAHDPEYVRTPVREEYEDILSWSDEIISWSIAPELEGAMDLAAVLKEKNILPAIAHSDATYEIVEKAYTYGYRHITHLYCATSSVMKVGQTRYSGIAESAYLIDDMTVELIADDRHIPESLLNMVYKLKGADHTALITDSLRAAGTKVQESVLGSLSSGQRIIIEDGVAKLPDRSKFAGSVVTMDKVLYNAHKIAGIPLVDAVKMMTLTPARIIGADSCKGSLEKQKDADIVIFNNDLDIEFVMVKGNPVYNK